MEDLEGQSGGVDSWDGICDYREWGLVAGVDGRGKERGGVMKAWLLVGESSNYRCEKFIN